MDHHRLPPRASVSPWLAVAVGVLLVPIARALSPDPPPPALVQALERARSRLDPARMGVRDLRRLPGIGARRALDVVAARRAHDPDGPPLRWSDVPGIGPVTEQRVTLWLARAGGEADRPLARGRAPDGDGVPGPRRVGHHLVPPSRGRFP
jgi:hypothetical protein